MMMIGAEVGRVAALLRYPVKSMGAEALDTVDVSWHGLAGDRRWAFIRDDMPRSGFPWLTIRQQPNMSLYTPSLAEPDRPDTSAIVVRTPSGRDLDILDPALADELTQGLDYGTRIIKQNRGIFDTMPLSLTTTQAIASVGALVDTTLDARRFRPNLLIEASGENAFPEDEWVGAVLQLGEMRMRIDQRDKRCVMVNIDPTTTQSDPSVLRAIARERQACLGVYGSVVQPGRISVGDRVVKC